MQVVVTPLTKPNCSWTSISNVDYQYFVHIFFTTQGMIHYCRIYLYIFPRLYESSMSKQAYSITRDIRHKSNAKMILIRCLKTRQEHILSERHVLRNNKLGILVEESSVSATLILLSGGILTPFFYQTSRHR